MGAGISVTDQAQMLGTLLAPLLEQYKAITETFCTSQDPKVQAQCAVLLDHIPSALTSLCKRMTTAFLDACGCRPNLVAALEVFVAALERMIHSDKVRHGIRVFMQQMITCMGDSLIPATPAFLRAMFSGGLCGVEELRDMMTLVGQMISKFKQKLSPVLDQAILPLVQAIFATLQSEVDPQDTNAVEEMSLLRRGYYGMLLKIMVHNLHNVFVSETNLPHLTGILETIAHGVAQADEPRTQKDCVNILDEMMKVWLQPPGVQGFSEFVFQQIVPACFNAILKPGFRLKDMECQLVIKAVVGALKRINSIGPTELSQFLQTQYFPSVGLPAEAAAQCANAVTELSQKDLVGFLKQFIHAAHS